MPELPEVETIRRHLAPVLDGRTIVAAAIEDWRLTRPADPAVIAAALQGAGVRQLSRHGKYLDVGLRDGRHLLIHLRMTGTLLLDPGARPLHARAQLTLSGGRRLVYVDPRRFGTFTLLGDPAERDAYLGARLGAEPLTSAFTVDYLRAQAAGRRAPVKAFVLDQRRIAGVGNIYADEALFRATIHPARETGRLSRRQIEALHHGIEAALVAGIDAKGASIDDFRHPDGARGSFQDAFLVHRREGQPCPRCGALITKLVVGGRGTYVCERCQPRPRGFAAAGRR